MSDNRRRKFRKSKQLDDKRPVTIARRNPEEAIRAEAEMQQPKILIKTRNDYKEDVEPSTSAEAASVQAPLKTIIVTRSEAAQSPSLGTVSPKVTREQTAESSAAAVTASTHIVEPVPQMTRPATVISSTGLINSTARKLFMKGNTDFLVVGVIGTQGVGKSTIMNILTNESLDYDYYTKVFVEQDSIFPTKLKPHKCSARSRTESTHMFITSDRTILLDGPPMLCNSYKKDMTTNELDDLRNIITFLSVCHLVIVVWDDYLNLSFMRQLQFAELMKPSQDNKPFANDYFPNLLFVKNRAKRHDYVVGQKECMDNMLKAFFKDSQLRVYVGQTAERQKKARVPEAERIINTFLFPEVQFAESSIYHAPLHKIIEDLRSRVFMTPRNEMYAGPNDFDENNWFNLLTKASQDTQHFFFNTYEDIQRRHLEVSGGGGMQGNSNSKDNHETWRD